MAQIHVKCVKITLFILASMDFYLELFIWKYSLEISSYDSLTADLTYIYIYIYIYRTYHRHGAFL